MDGVGELYAALAPIYEEWQSSDGRVPFAEVVGARLEPMLRSEAPVRPLAFLDAGCGTGTLLRGLRQRHAGWRLAGVDQAAAMLGVAVRQPDAGSIAWARARLDAPLPFGRVFDAAGCFYDTLNHLPDGAALRRALAGLAAVLRPGGLLVFDVTNAVGFQRWWRGQPAFAGTGWRMTIEMEFDPATQRGLAEVAISRRGEPERRFHLTERHFPPEEVETALAASGFRTVNQQPWAPFAGDRPGKTWWVARRLAT